MDCAGMGVLSGCAHPAVVDGQDVMDPDAWIDMGFARRGVGRGGTNRHVIQE